MAEIAYELEWRERTATLLSTYIRCNQSTITNWDKNDETVMQIQSDCITLFKKDYDVELLDNRDGQLCSTYPPYLILITSEKAKSRVNSKDAIKVLLQQGARFARVRTRFVFPVILFNGKNICRSSTLSQMFETLFQSTTNSLKSKFSRDDEDTIGSNAPSAQVSVQRQNPEPTALNSLTPTPAICDYETKEQTTTYAIDSASGNASSPDKTDKKASIMDKYRTLDILLLQQLSVTHICDLMLENARRMYGLNIYSSEKRDTHQRYQSKFKISVIPYPGVEFFREFDCLNPSAAKSLKFDWSRLCEDPAELKIPINNIAIPWSDYQQWDIIKLTQNYLKLMLNIICDPESKGLLVHCISGWDRTPTMISLLRLSLWADGLIHQSLSPDEILFLTIGYDWMLFRHALVMRQSKGEDIFFFCFHFLTYITGKEFSVHYISRKRSNGAYKTTSIPTPSFRPLESSRPIADVSRGRIGEAVGFSQPVTCKNGDSNYFLRETTDHPLSTSDDLEDEDTQLWDLREYRLKKVHEIFVTLHKEHVFPEAQKLKQKGRWSWF